ncbi:hypothetical protein DVJ83_15510 (plasmid) [Deinococcus wulumuqiensis]|uniref:Uncharacterized protein n=1 Tax=Deinococcus wulumuqiensis TaxID=980427 RepID=A0A345ILK3_9DEIO|nr:hypothetical protein [Deinococcus wulumuqiensis]AXH00576.1 hypothetical protein DVJ83_15510 [Deinococcus wulumuqiensis]
MTNASFSSEVLPELRAQATTPAPEQPLVRYALICAWLTARCEKAGRQEVLVGHPRQFGPHPRGAAC